MNIPKPSAAAPVVIIILKILLLDRHSSTIMCVNNVYGACLVIVLIIRNSINHNINNKW